MGGCVARVTCPFAFYGPVVVAAMGSLLNYRKSIFCVYWLVNLRESGHALIKLLTGA